MGGIISADNDTAADDKVATSGTVNNLQPTKRVPIAEAVDEPSDGKTSELNDNNREKNSSALLVANDGASNANSSVGESANSTASRSALCNNLILNADRLMLCDKSLDDANTDEPELVRDKVKKCVREKNPRNPVVGKIDDNRIIWLCKASCSASDIKEIVDCNPENRLIHLNTGTHGDPRGNTRTCLDVEVARGKTKNRNKHKLVCASNFIKEDAEMVFSEPCCSLHIVSKYAGPIYPKHRDVIDAWCWSYVKYPERKHTFDESRNILRDVNDVGYSKIFNSGDNVARKIGDQADLDLKLIGLSDDQAGGEPDDNPEVNCLKGRVGELKALSENIDSLIGLYSQKIKQAKNSPRLQKSSNEK